MKKITGLAERIKDVRKTGGKILNAQETGRVNNKCTGKGKLVNYVRERGRVVK